LSLDRDTPVLVGVGVASRRCEDPREALEPVSLMVEAAEKAAQDAGSRRLLAELSSVRVPRGFWDYADPGRLVAERVGASAARSGLAEIGVLQQTLLNAACRAVAEGRERVALVTGADSRYRTQRAKALGIELRDSEQSDVVPDERLEPAEGVWHDLEAASGLMMPVQFFSLMESALRHAEGLSVEAHRDRIAGLWARMSEVAAANPDAWHRAPRKASEIRDAAPGNRMMAFPYTRSHNSDWNVDQGAALLICSVETARAHGVPEQRWVHPLAGTEANHMVPLACREALDRSPGAAVAGRRLLELGGCAIEDVDHVELYSCFPAPVQIFARELGIALERPLTVTGGMAFAGGPLNNYVLQSTARMAGVLRADPGSRGLVSSLSGFNNKQGFSLWSTEAGRARFRYEDCSAEVAAATKPRELVADREGPVRVAGYTVLYLGERPAKVIAVCDRPDGRRCIVTSEDPDLASAMTRDEWCGRELH